MKEVLITRDHLLKYMTEENYYEFVEDLKSKLESKQEPIWILAQTLEEKDRF